MSDLAVLAVAISALSTAISVYCIVITRMRYRR
jgi:hypothetical protein